MGGSSWSAGEARRRSASSLYHSCSAGHFCRHRRGAPTPGSVARRWAAAALRVARQTSAAVSPARCRPAGNGALLLDRVQVAKGDRVPRLGEFEGIGLRDPARLGFEGLPHAAFGLAHQSFGLEGFVAPAAACWMYVGAVAESMRKISYAGYRLPPEAYIRRFGSISGSHSAFVTSRICSRSAGSRSRMRPCAAG